METTNEENKTDVENKTTNDESSPTKKDKIDRLFNSDAQVQSDQDDSIEEKNEQDSEEQKTDQAKLEQIMNEVRSRLPPPNPLLPKSYVLEDEPLKIGGMAKFFILGRFIGRDRADLINDICNPNIPKNEFPPSTTLNSLFPINDKDAMENIVYLRDIGQGQTEAPTAADITKGCINSNTLDIK